MKIKRGIYIIPNLLTTGNVFCGFYAIVAIINNQFYSAAVAIIIAIIFDGLDGRVSRLTHSSSDFGLEYDSLADLISFGIAPALLTYVWVLKPFGRIGWMASFLFVICGALRLARYNTNASIIRDYSFRGLPIPAAAGVIASLVIMTKEILSIERTEPIIMVIIVYLLAFLMVSNIRYRSLKGLELKKRRPFNMLVFSILFIYIIATIPEIMIFLITVIYALSGPVEGLLFTKHLKPAARRLINRLERKRSDQ
ncbi:MAG: CDP-diacylglycerol--serine O-phosphatidyltransferase [Nitrospinae bacterium]|nr:CDP-diacylglycerol--serine O-phosphatidyltransferase [Nitrospinota bacterium]